MLLSTILATKFEGGGGGWVPLPRTAHVVEVSGLTSVLSVQGLLDDKRREGALEVAGMEEIDLEALENNYINFDDFPADEICTYVLFVVQRLAVYNSTSQCLTNFGHFL